MPRRISVGDVLQIEVTSNLETPIHRSLLLKPSMVTAIGDDGLVSLGGIYSAVQVTGKTIAEAERAIAATIKGKVDRASASNEQNPTTSKGVAQVNVRLVYVGRDTGDDLTVLRKAIGANRPIAAAVTPGDTLQIESFVDGLSTRRAVVEPDGSLPLGARWGRVNVGGKTLLETEAAVRAHLEQHLKDPEVQVTQAGNSLDGYSPGQIESGRSMEIINQFQRDISELKLMLREFRNFKPR